MTIDNIQLIEIQLFEKNPSLRFDINELILVLFGAILLLYTSGWLIEFILNSIKYMTSEKKLQMSLIDYDTLSIPLSQIHAASNTTFKSSYTKPIITRIDEIRYLLFRAKVLLEYTKQQRKNVRSIRDYTGFIIGKCENILIFVFVIFDQYTALALIFTAKTIVRAESIKVDPLYYLAGTMINVTYSIIIALFIKYLISTY